MRILFIGSSYSSKILLKQCFKLKLNIVGVCTLKKSFNHDFCDLIKHFKNKKVPKIYCNDINSMKIRNWIYKRKPDLIFCFGWSQLLPKKIYSIPQFATIGFHPTALPMNRGRHPIIWSLVLGLKKTASSFFVINNQNPDDGFVISQKKISISKNDNSNSLYKKILRVAVLQLPIIMNFFLKKKRLGFKKSTRSNIWRKRDYNDGKIDWRMSARNIYNLFRALEYPYMNSHFNFKNKEYKILKCKILSPKDNKKNNFLEPGKILKKTKLFFDVKCGEGVLRILRLNKKINIKEINYL